MSILEHLSVLLQVFNGIFQTVKLLLKFSYNRTKLSW